MPEEPKSILASIEGSYQFYTFLFTTFVIFMGTGSWLGQRIWHRYETERRRAAKQPVASFALSDGDKSFSHTSLFQGGLFGVFQLGVLLLYVVFMVGWTRGSRITEDYALDPSATLKSVAVLMGYPILMLALLVIAFLVVVRRTLSLGLPYPGFAGIALAVAIGVVPFFWIRNGWGILALQAFSLTMLCFHFSYVYGMILGVRAANPTLSSRVSVEVVHGNGLADAWLYEWTDSDYRLVTPDGSNHIIPATNVKEIREIKSVGS